MQEKDTLHESQQIYYTSEDTGAICLDRDRKLAIGYFGYISGFSDMNHITGGNAGGNGERKNEGQRRIEKRWREKVQHNNMPLICIRTDATQNLKAPNCAANLISCFVTVSSSCMNASVCVTAVM